MSSAHLAWSQARLFTKRPWPWIFLGIMLVTTQVGFWTDIFWDSRFDPHEVDARFSRGVSVLNYFAFGPVFAAALMASLLRTGWKEGSVALQLAVRLLVVIACLATLPIFAFLVSFPAALLADAIPFSPEPGRGYSEYYSWSKSFDRYGRTLFALIPYALLSALIASLISSRVVAAAIVAAFAVIETMILDFTIGWFDSLEWIFGLSISHMYYYWIDQEDAIWSMKNILGLSDDVQGLLVLSIHAIWMAVAICWLAGRRQCSKKAAADQSRSD